MTHSKEFHIYFFIIDASKKMMNFLSLKVKLTHQELKKGITSNVLYYDIFEN